MTSASDPAARAELRAAVRRCLDRSDGPRPYLAGEPGTSEPYDRKLWHVLTGEIGITGLFLPEDLGGSAGAFTDAAAVAEELGRGLAPVPFIPTVGLAGVALLQCLPDPAARELLSRLVGPDVAATVAWCSSEGAVTPGAADIRADYVDGAWRVTGTAGFVVGGVEADLILVPAPVDGRIALFAVDARTSEVAVTALTSLDLLRPLATVKFRSAEARLLTYDADHVMNTAVDCTLVLVAAEQVGAAQRCLDDTVAYARQRVQFDRPIGSFQAIKHKLVDVLLDVEMARSAADVGARAAETYLLEPTEANAGQLALMASLAKSTCADAYVHTATETLHIHGGIGFTWEHDAHLHFRRAKAGELYLGTPDQHRERLAAHAGLMTHE